MEFRNWPKAHQFIPPPRRLKIGKINDHWVIIKNLSRHCINRLIAQKRGPSIIPREAFRGSNGSRLFYDEKIMDRKAKSSQD